MEEGALELQAEWREAEGTRRDPESRVLESKTLRDLESTKRPDHQKLLLGRVVGVPAVLGTSPSRTYQPPCVCVSSYIWLTL